MSRRARYSGRIGLLAVVGAALVATPSAWAEEPFRLGSQIEDRAGALDGQPAEVQAALDELRREDDIQLWVAYVDSFSGVAAQEWADQTAERSDLGLSDVLLAVAVGDRAYAYSVDEQFPLSDDELARLADREIEPQLADDDWAGAAVAAANGLGNEGSSESGGGGSGWLLPLVGGLLLVGIVWLLVSRLRGRSRDEAETATLEEPLVSLDELSKRGSGLLVEVDDAVKTSEQEVAFAAAQFGDEAAAPFAAAVEGAKAELAKAFQIRRQIDDSTPEDDGARRELLSEIISLAQRASDRLDSEAERFDELRAVERNAPELLASLAGRLESLQARVPVAEATLARLGSTYAGTAVAPVRENLGQAAERMAFARTELDEGNQELAAGRRGHAAVAIRATEEAVAQATQLFDAIDRLAVDLEDADDKIRAALPAVAEDVATAGSLSAGRPELAAHVARAEQALAAAELAASPTDGQDPLTALRQLEEAGDALNAALAEAQESHEKLRRAEATLEATLAGVRTKIEAADDFITTRRGAVGAGARTRLAEAKRYFESALTASAGDASVRLEHARTADGLAEQALRLADQDVEGYGQGPITGLPGFPGGSGGGGALGNILMGGVLIDLLRGGGGGQGGGGMFPGGFGPGSFGGVGSRGRRGGGGRF